MGIQTLDSRKTFLKASKGMEIGKTSTFNGV